MLFTKSRATIHLMSTTPSFQPKKSDLITYLQGMTLGIAEIIPGVSGSTIALLFGIYDDFIAFMYDCTELVKITIHILLGKQKPQAFVKHLLAIRWRFGISLGLGMMTSIIVLSGIISFVLITYPSYLYAALMGLTIPTMLIVKRQAGKYEVNEKIITAGTALVFLGLFHFGGQFIQNSGLQTNPLYIMVAAMIAISAMVLPGISGSFMLLLFGLYGTIVSLISKATTLSLTASDITTLAFFGMGIGLGFLTTVRVLKRAFESHRSALMSFLLGLLFASWYVLWPFVNVIGIEHNEPILEKISPFSMNPIQSLVLFVIIFLVGYGTYALHDWIDRMNPPAHDDDITKI